MRNNIKKKKTFINRAEVTLKYYARYVGVSIVLSFLRTYRVQYIIYIYRHIGTYMM